MNVYIIRIPKIQTEKFLINSLFTVKSGLTPVVVDAVVPDTIDSSMMEFKYFNRSNFKWNWPVSEDQNGLDLQTGLYKFAYRAADQKKKVACSLSHMLQWDDCVTKDEPRIVCEADARFIRRPDDDLETFKGHKVIGLNDPRGATRRPYQYHSQMLGGIQPVPKVVEAGEDPVPQGLAGNSAYYIEPAGAKELLDRVRDYGMFPNDAYMCRELFPWLRVIHPYYTRVSGDESTTTT